jgi:glutathione synthase/RimK-type ligase-like ATP-grasp enzyme
MNADNTDSLKRIGLVTCQKYMDMTPDEQALMLALADLGIEAAAVAWDDPQVDWGGYGGLFVRTVWNYHEHPEAFREWITAVEQMNVPVWNAPEIICWNMEKTYLQDLAQQGVAIVPTVWVEKGKVSDLADILVEQGWEEAVVKPVISASAYETWVTGVETAVFDQSRFEKMVMQRAVMVQQKMPIEQGEWSLIFLGGRYSHAVLKRPAAGDFRVQEEYGGTSTQAQPPESLIEQARQIPTVSDSLYVRVDGMDVNGRFILMELELIEPYLFLDLAVGSVEKFAAQILTNLGGH